jgi:hypothetical protein
MKKLILAILLTSLIGFNSYSNPINPNSIGFEKIVSSFDNTLTSLFNHDVELDEGLRQSCINVVSRETEGINDKNKENLAYFYQIWELEDLPEMYLSEGLCTSLTKMILNKKFSDYMPLIDANRFWVECIKKDNKYYLVVALK